MNNIVILTLGLPNWRLPFYIDMVKEGIKVFVLTNSDVEYEKAINNGLFPLGYRFFCGGIWPNKIINLKQYDVVVSIYDLRLVPYLLFNVPMQKIYFWGIGYGNKLLGNLIRKYLSKKTRGVISYMPIDSQKSNYIINSIYNDQCKNLWSSNKNILFIGGLNQRKRLDILVQAIYFCLLQGVHFKVHIIGDGHKKEELINLVKRYNLEELFVFHGEIELSSDKEAVIKNSFISVSPGQAGLSILESFSYGIPFVTWKNAISGGEVLNITDKFNGYLLDNLCPIELANKLVYLSQNIDEVQCVSNNAFNYYRYVASGELMTKRFLSIVSNGSMKQD